MKYPTKPYAPVEPIHPESFWFREFTINLEEDKVYSIQDIIDLLPENIKLEDLCIYKYSESHEDKYGDYQDINCYKFYYEGKINNPNYQDQIVKYEKDLARYEKDKKSYDEKFKNIMKI
jgi:hypothetical protein